LLRESSRETVEFGRPIALAIAPIEWPTGASPATSSATRDPLRRSSVSQ
jgi:hypothetical protein